MGSDSSPLETGGVGGIGSSGSAQDVESCPAAAETIPEGNAPSRDEARNMQLSEQQQQQQAQRLQAQQSQQGNAFREGQGQARLGQQQSQQVQVQFPPIQPHFLLGQVQAPKEGGNQAQRQRSQPACVTECHLDGHQHSIVPQEAQGEPQPKVHAASHGAPKNDLVLPPQPPQQQQRQQQQGQSTSAAAVTRRINTKLSAREIMSLEAAGVGILNERGANGIVFDDRPSKHFALEPHAAPSTSLISGSMSQKAGAKKGAASRGGLGKKLKARSVARRHKQDKKDITPAPKQSIDAHGRGGALSNSASAEARARYKARQAKNANSNEALSSALDNGAWRRKGRKDLSSEEEKEEESLLEAKQRLAARKYRNSEDKQEGLRRGQGVAAPPGSAASPNRARYRAKQVRRGDSNEAIIYPAPGNGVWRRESSEELSSEQEKETKYLLRAKQRSVAHRSRSSKDKQERPGIVVPVIDRMSGESEERILPFDEEKEDEGDNHLWQNDSFVQWSRHQQRLEERGSGDIGAEDDFTTSAEVSVLASGASASSGPRSQYLSCGLSSSAPLSQQHPPGEPYPRPGIAVYVQSRAEGLPGWASQAASEGNRGQGSNATTLLSDSAALARDAEFGAAGETNIEERTGAGSLTGEEDEERGGSGGVVVVRMARLAPPALSTPMAAAVVSASVGTVAARQGMTTEIVPAERLTDSSGTDEEEGNLGVNGGASNREEYGGNADFSGVLPWRRPGCGRRGVVFLAASLMAVIIVAVVFAGVVRPNETESPAAMGASDVHDLIRDLFREKALGDPSSPQSRALRWLHEEDGEVQSLGSSLDRLSRANILRVAQRYGLAVLYYSTGDESWTDHCSFLSPEKSECEWRGEDGNKGERGVKCNTFGEVVEIKLHGNNLTGTIPVSELRVFPSLTRLQLGENRLRGGIPPELAELANLQDISLEKNHLTGPLIKDFGNLQALVNFNVMKNDLNSTIPPSVTKLSGLQQFDVRENALTGPIPSDIGDMTSLVNLLLNYNHLTSTIPQSWQQMDRLRDFRVSGNRLNGTFPLCPTCHRNLGLISASENQFSGTVPSLFGMLPKLRYLWLNENRFHGTIPPSFGGAPELRIVILDSNSLTGTIPPEMFANKAFEAVALGSNDLTGSLPSTFGSPSKVWALSAEMNRLTGTIPSTYGNLPAMTGVSLHSNMLSGTIPPSLGENPAMIRLMLENNLLTGSIPGTFAKLGSHVLWLSLARNGLQGNFDHVCSAETEEARIITADCAEPNAEVSCDCCLFCCNDAEGSCDHHLSVMAYVNGCLADGSCAPTDGFAPCV